jgi:hypothetical protein
MRELGEYTPLRSYERFESMMKHFNKYIRKHLEMQYLRFAKRGRTTYIRFIYDSPNGTPTKRQQMSYINQWSENGINDHLDSEFGCTITPHLLISPSGHMVMLNISVEWQTSPI